mmetsp:Transcript_24524/g.42167  ORF Transcript_24524/g.42167 Transcript_24524/m.42167 type:complete len:245 (-) Transcript_24524:552-1286(-)
MSSRTRVYVGHLSSRTRERDLEELFARYGRILKCDVKFGYAFVEYEDERDAEDAIRSLDGRDVDGSQITVERSKGPRSSGSARPPMRSEYRCIVTQMAQYTSWQDLKDFARQAGNVVYTDVFMERGRKFGIIEYSSKDDLRKATRDLHDRKLGGVRVGVHEDDGRSYSSYHDRDRSRSRSPKRSSSRRSPARASPKHKSRSGSRSRSPSPKRQRAERSPSPEEPRRSASPRRSPVAAENGDASP